MKANMTKISNLPSDSSPTTTDLVPTVDVETNTTKKSTLANLITLFFNNIPNLKITNASLKDGAGEPGGAWTAYTPTFTNLTQGTSPTIDFAYKQVGKTVTVRFRMALGTGGSIGTQPTFTLPVPSVDYVTQGVYLGTARILDFATAGYPANVIWYSTTTFTLFVYVASGTYAVEQNLSASSPFTFGVGDSFMGTFTYEAA